MKNFNSLQWATLLLSLLLGTASMNAQSCIDLFNQAKALQAKGNKEEAISYYKRAMQCDPNLRSDCEKRIRECYPDVLEISNQEVIIPYYGGDQKIEIVANKKWQIDKTENWCSTEPYDKKSFVVQCREVNNSTREKSTNLTIKSGSLFKTIKVVQEGRPEYIEADATSLAFPSVGSEQQIAVESNANWDITAAPAWCNVEKDDEGIRIVVGPNDRIIERRDKIVIESPSQAITIKIYQGAGDEHLTLSQNDMYFSPEGDVNYLKIYTDADNWFIGDYPNWMNVQKVGSDSIRIQCGKNIPNGEPRSGSVQIKTDRQTAGVMITQGPRMAQDIIFPHSKLIGGHNFSLGISASYYIPMVSASAGGDYVGSVLDYSLGTKEENASYKSGVGYSLGLFADIRLYKNLYLIAGANFTQIKYKNEFNKSTTLVMPHTAYQYLKGEVYNSYKEDYSYTMLEIPILASYRFKVNDVSHVQVNFGPVLNFGLSAKMKLSGNTDSESLRMYNTITHQPVDNSNYVRHIGINSDFNLYQPCVMWYENYTTGNIATVPHHDEFTASPLKRINCGLRLGAAYEIAGLSFGLYYTMMVTNMANKGYWENKRWTVLNESNAIMSGYKQHINTLEFKLAYTLRYINTKKK